MNLEQRIEKLETLVRNFCTVASWVGLVAVLWFGGSSIRSFISCLRSSPDTLEVIMSGEQANSSVQIHAEENHIMVTDHNGNPLARMSTKPEYRGTIALYGSDEEPLFISNREE